MIARKEKAMRNKMIVAAVVAVVVVSALAIVSRTRQQGDYARSPMEGESRIVNMTNLPPTENVLNREGVMVGVVKTEHYLTDIYPYPVYGPDEKVVGHLGLNGYWPLGEEEPALEGAVTTIQGFDENGKLVEEKVISHIDYRTEWPRTLLTEEVVDREGTVVGVVHTGDRLAGVYPYPVYGPNGGEIVGHIGINGYWVLGEEEPITKGSVITIREFYGSTTRTRQYNGRGELMRDEVIHH